ncbi:preprotein translocase, YajC subunit [Alicyclobacillus hesperidum URH17-3-68]|uniref:Preprotein translocase subunit YajC n=1 Tax=Alicyclobacillus hesperidum TaxID=89784 RepID=A0A1H2Q401_9BACL|nr:preprotein translocase subunit YajC [Alicyclobacillus hesperidum]EJY56315.1 preprotein translocase, YajC subunit [Alicyclobacillus hesperidum URH17-3-68]GLV12840.1 hypothetical protein Heshes_05240 [Alicyclobacillus hesperidum]SDW01384.1 preprotein translocase subunit YajC [Alicyclobacillus hesperidum]
MKGGSSLIFLIIVVIVFYFLMIVPQRRQQKKRAEMMKQIGPGARVMTASGLYAEVVETRGDIVVAQIAEGVNVEMDQRAVVRVIEEGPAQYNDEVDELPEADDNVVSGVSETVDQVDDELTSSDAERQFDEHHKQHGES